MDACWRTGRLTKTTGLASNASSCAVEPARRDHHEPVDVPEHRPGCSHLLVGVLSGVDEEHLQVGLPSRALHRSDERRKVGIRDVRDDHGDVAGPSGDEPAGGSVRHEAEVAHRLLDPVPGGRRHLLGDVDGAGHGRRVDAGPLSDVEDRHALRGPHDARRYTAPAEHRMER